MKWPLLVIALCETWQEWRQSVPHRLGMPLGAMIRQIASRDVLKASGAQALLMPTTVRAAMRVDEGENCLLNGSMQPTFATFVRQTSPASVAGSPSISIPAGLLGSGLPFGLMLDALPGDDRLLLALAQQVKPALTPGNKQ
jgi:indoleacetamide hydrolase